MPNTTYRIKLYGHTNPDPQGFCKSLGIILGTDEQGARAILQQVPVVIKQDLPKDRAGALMETLNLIKALAILEQEGGPGGEAVEVGSPLSVLEEVAAEVPEEETPWRSRLLAPAALAAGLVLMIFIAVALLPSLTKRPAPPRQAVGQRGLPPKQSYSEQLLGSYRGYTAEQLEAEGEKLVKENEELTSKRQLTEKVVAGLYANAGVDPALLDERRSELKQIRNRIRRNARELRAIEYRLQTIEREQYHQRLRQERSRKASPVQTE